MIPVPFFFQCLETFGQHSGSRMGGQSYLIPRVHRTGVKVPVRFRVDVFNTSLMGSMASPEWAWFCFILRDSRTAMAKFKSN